VVIIRRASTLCEAGISYLLLCVIQVISGHCKRLKNISEEFTTTDAEVLRYSNVASIGIAVPVYFFFESKLYNYYSK